MVVVGDEDEVDVAVGGAEDVDAFHVVDLVVGMSASKQHLAVDYGTRA